jgi:hypothetical protein
MFIVTLIRGGAAAQYRVQWALVIDGDGHLP